uniref:Uncharacterized protein n=1 Tax=Cucumis sativus TaxID=3659 RepID=A0A0A0KDZ6_CUCSA
MKNQFLNPFLLLSFPFPLFSSATLRLPLPLLSGAAVSSSSSSSSTTSSTSTFGFPFPIMITLIGFDPFSSAFLSLFPVSLHHSSPTLFLPIQFFSISS